jgi:DNA-binding GntR family transcriptional regulator
MPYKREMVEQAMRSDIRVGRLTLVDLQKMLEKELASKYDVSRDTARKARNAVVSNSPKS